ncbi:MAG: hypothetical protein ACYS8Z_05975 [Planctomycetota bacterium]|jgi:probable HAF family extracellular repeat protein
MIPKSIKRKHYIKLIAAIVIVGLIAIFAGKYLLAPDSLTPPGYVHAYKVTYLPLKDKNLEWIVATAINDHGQVAGSCGTTEENEWAFFWDREQGTKYIYEAGWKRCSTDDINNAGQVVGAYQDTTGTWYLFFWDPDKGLTNITACGALPSIARLNDSGQVTGSAQLLQADGSKARHAFVWDAENGLKDMGVGILADKTSTGIAINDSGTVVGLYGAKPNSNSSTFTRGGAFIWNSRSPIPIKELKIAEDHYSSVSDISNDGQIVGRLGKADKNHAFVWDPEDGLLDLADLVGEHSMALRINQSGHVLGLINAPAQPRLLLRRYKLPQFLQGRPYSRSRFVFRPPDDVIYLEHELGVSAFEAHDINSRGEILIYHYKKKRSLIMTPISSKPAGK